MASNTNPASSVLAKLRSFQTSSRARTPAPLKSLAVFMLAFNHPGVAFVRPSHRSSLNGHLPGIGFVPPLRQVIGHNHNFALNDRNTLTMMSLVPGGDWNEGKDEFYQVVAVRSILALQQGIASANLDRAELAMQFKDIFVQLSQEDTKRIRFELDTNLVFGEDGVHVDLRALVFDVLDEASRVDILRHISGTCNGVLNHHPGHYTVLTDVDDTLKPGKDLFKLSGEDRSWYRDGSLYPGAVQIHRELRGFGPDDFSVVLTARPPNLCKSLPSSLARLTGAGDKPRLSILPGFNENVGSVLTQDFGELGQRKFFRFQQYAQLYPDLCGKFVFIGDDGKADDDAALAMLAQTHPETRRHLVAWVAIHAVQAKDGTFKFNEEEREQYIRRGREAFPAIEQGSRAYDWEDGSQPHRFFYYENYSDLASQLYEARWISHDSEQRVLESFVAEGGGLPLRSFKGRLKDKVKEKMKEVAGKDATIIASKIKGKVKNAIKQIERTP